MILPKFVVIGTPRSNTRWLAQCLSEHPQIALPPDEVYFFTSRRLVVSNWSNGLEWYSGLFENCVVPGNITWGEVTPVYLFDDDTPHLMHKTIPDAKLICCLRDQSERAYSWYRLFLHFNPDIFLTDYSFAKFLTYATEVYGREGFYFEHLKRYLALYSRESMLVLLNDDLLENPVGYIQKVYRFLGVDSTFIPPSIKEHINPMSLEIPRSKIIHQVTKKIIDHYTLQNRTPPQFIADIGRVNTYRVLQKDFPARHQLIPEMRAKLFELYQEHNKELGEFLGRDLSHWNIDKGENTWRTKFICVVLKRACLIIAYLITEKPGSKRIGNVRIKGRFENSFVKEDK